MKAPWIPLALLLLAALPAAAAEPAIVVSGEVHDAAGAPLAGAHVALLHLPDSAAAARLALLGRSDPDPTAEATTDALGRYRLAVPEAGMWSLRVTARDTVPLALPLQPLLEETELPPAAPAGSSPTRR
ncbi:MAG TPA: carboxypeptidase-like regulatory domain-containing protein, partial [Thermoanaerobaculia bacterium]